MTDQYKSKFQPGDKCWTQMKRLVFVSYCTCLVHVLLILSACVSAHNESEEGYPLLIISFDGFRWDYLSLYRGTLPNFEKVKTSGIYVTDGVKNVFDTSTLPNHWTLVTGLYPESHGVISNHIRDANIAKVFVPKYIDPSYNNDPRYYDDGGEPIWATNQVQGGESGSVMWWGSDNTVKWSQPTFQVPYNNYTSFSEKIDITVGWLTQEHPINLGLLYFPEPDHIGHKYGPDSDEVQQQILVCDQILGYLFQKLNEKDLLDDLNIIITADHGMASTSNQSLIFLDELINIEDYDILSYDSTMASIFPHEGKLDQVYAALKKASDIEGSHFKVYLAKDIPERFHIKNNARVPPIMAIADLHYRLIANTSREDEFLLAGAHGYDNEEKDMRPFFMALGPSFKKGFTVSSFNSVDVYPLMCHLLGIKPAPNNGTLDNVAPLLQEEDDEEEEASTVVTVATYLLVLFVVTFVGGVFAVAACRQHRFYKHRRAQLQLSTIGARMRMSPPHESAYKLVNTDDEDDEEEFLSASEGRVKNL